MLLHTGLPDMTEMWQWCKTMCYGVADWFYLKKRLNSIVLSGANNDLLDGIMLSCPVKTNLPRPTSCMTETMFHASWILNVQCCLQAFNILHLEELSRQLPCCPRKSLFAGVLVHLENSNSKNAIDMGDFFSAQCPWLASCFCWIFHRSLKVQNTATVNSEG